MLIYKLIFLVIYLTSTALCSNDYNHPSSNQYHIQTDEGPERYFRYQTDSGQYRKEKHLEDGTVIGTYAWIDDNGFLRQRDYIADNAGYRILKSKNVFVGKNVPVGDAVKSTKKYAASAGTLVKNNQGFGRPVVRPVVISSTTARPYVEISPNAFQYSTTTGGPILSSSPNYIDITPSTPSGLSISTPLTLLIPPKNTSKYYSTQYSTTAAPTLDYLPPSVQYLPPSSTPAPNLDYLPPASVQYLPPSTPVPSTQYLPQNYDYNQQDINQNSLDYNNPYVRQVDNNYVFHNGPTYPIDRNGQTYNSQRIGNGYDPQYPEYDGVSVTNDGFRYYIPRAYHEEQTAPGDKRSGSFGYIDPFGIRRVIYYNTAPGTGFQHKKNNRYVGFQATPYDPRPY